MISCIIFFVVVRKFIHFNKVMMMSATVSWIYIVLHVAH